MALDLSTWISEIRTAVDPANEQGKTSAWSKIAPRLGPMFQVIQDAINQSASAAGVDATKHSQQPDPPAKLNVKVGGEQAHVTVEDNSVRSRSRNYFLEYSNNTSLSGAHVHHMGVSRGAILNLPTFPDGESETKHNWYFRTYSMEPGSEKPSSHVYFGQQGAPTPVQMNGTTQLTLNPSTGAGTAPSNGQKPGQGYGHAQNSDETFTKGK